MQPFFITTTLGVLVLLAWQDFRSRLISWWLLPLLLAGIVAAGLQQTNLRSIAFYFSINMLFIAFQFGVLFIWFSLRKKQWTNIFREAIGTGDLLFLVCMAASFSTVNFIVALCGGFIVSLLLYLPFTIKKRNNPKTIPLAGLLAVELIGLFAWRWCDADVNFYSDNYWIMLLN